jgi:hypothetical protein
MVVRRWQLERTPLRSFGQNFQATYNDLLIILILVIILIIFFN